MGDKKTKNFKEKFVSIYESFFKGEDFTVKPSNFWEELFLLKLNSNFIINEFKSLSTNDDLIKLKKNINFLYNKAIEFLKFETNPFRLHNVIHTLYLFTYSISVTTKIKLNSIETLEFLVGIDNAECKFETIFYSIYGILTSDETAYSIKTIALKYLLALATQVENLNDNLFIEHFMFNNSIFEAIIQLISNSSTRAILGRDALLLLTILLQYQKYDSENPYIVKLSILDDEMALTGLAQVMSSSLAEYNRLYGQYNQEQEGQSTWSVFRVGTLIGNMFVGDEERRRLLTPDDSILLVFYESVHLNRNFISALTHAATELSSVENSSTSPTKTESTKISDQSSDHDKNINNENISNSENGQGLMMKQFPNNKDNMRLLNEASNLNDSAIILNNEETSQSQQFDTSSNLLVIYLQSCSSALQETKMQNTYDSTKLFMLILVCISEDQYANSLLHDSNILYSVFLYQAKLRHRKLNIEKVLPSRQLACSILDLTIEFMQSHLMKNFPFELYMKALGIIQRLMCYQKKYHIRLNYNWQNLWTCLIYTLKFVVSCDSSLMSKGNNIFLLYSKIIVVFNIFITYGDTFLPNPESYDYLYYDIMRMRQVFDNFLLLLNRYASSSEWKDISIRLMNQMSNIKSIINHFTPKIDAWSNENKVASLTEEQVLQIVRTNYDSLTLKLEDDLDQYDRYAENPNEKNFFSNLTKKIIQDTRSNLSDISKFDQLNSLSFDHS